MRSYKIVFSPPSLHKHFRSNYYVKCLFSLESGALQRLGFDGHEKVLLESIPVWNTDTPFKSARKILSRAKERLSEGILHPTRAFSKTPTLIKLSILDKISKLG